MKAVKTPGYVELLTDPKCHRQDNFVYMIHSIGGCIWGENGLANDRLLRRSATSKLSKISTSGMIYHASLIGRRDAGSSKEIFGHDRPLSKLGMLGDIGIIVVPPSETHILLALETDRQSPKDQTRLREMAMALRAEEMKSPLELLRYAAKRGDIGDHNEIIVEGDPKTIIEGVVYVDTGFFDVKRCAELLRKRVMEHTGTALPIIELPSLKVRFVTKFQ